MTIRRLSRHVFRIFTIAVIAGYANTASACGHCHGDKVAAVYDHAVIVKAIEKDHGVEFAEVIGVFRMSGKDNATLAREVASIDGIDKDAVRVSANPSAVSFAFAPRKGSAADMIGRINKRIKNRKWTLVHLQTIGPHEKK